MRVQSRGAEEEECRDWCGASSPEGAGAATERGGLRSLYQPTDITVHEHLGPCVSYVSEQAC